MGYTKVVVILDIKDLPKRSWHIQLKRIRAPKTEQRLGKYQSVSEDVQTSFGNVHLLPDPNQCIVFLEMNINIYTWYGGEVGLGEQNLQHLTLSTEALKVQTGAVSIFSTITTLKYYWL